MANDSSYTGLRRAQLSLDYLHSNSTTHEFLFGALAELIDNSRDAQASELKIFAEKNDSFRGGHLLYFLDDGEGMSPEETARVITFGYSAKRACGDDFIGMYGNGLKSGSMRVGKDLILFTKKKGVLTVLLLSRTFHEEERLNEVIVPVPSFDAETMEPASDLYATPAEFAMHQREVNIILKYSPFKARSDLVEQFERIGGDSGTLVVCYNLKLLDTGEPELTFTEDDIELASVGMDGDPLSPPHDELSSFKAYVSLLYFAPRMKIYIQNHKVQTRRLVLELAKPRLYRFTSARFKARSEALAKKAEEDAKRYASMASEADWKVREMERKLSSVTDLAGRQALRKAQEEAAKYHQEAALYRRLSDRKNKDVKTLTIYTGLRVSKRCQDGAFFYNCGRLIKMFAKLPAGPNQEALPRGLCAIVDVPYAVLEPTHNKQDFADKSEFRLLERAVADHLLSYWRNEVGLDTSNSKAVTKFWEEYGYQLEPPASGPFEKKPPSDEPKFERKRRFDQPIAIQCDSCLKWRTLPFTQSPPQSGSIAISWTCSMNPDAKQNQCAIQEQRFLENIKEAKLLKPSGPSQAEMAEKLQFEIERKSQQLAKIAPPSRTAMKAISAPPVKTPSTVSDTADVPTRSLRIRQPPATVVQTATLENKQRVSPKIPAKGSAKISPQSMLSDDEITSDDASRGGGNKAKKGRLAILPKSAGSTAVKFAAAASNKKVAVATKASTNNKITTTGKQPVASQESSSSSSSSNSDDSSSSDESEPNVIQSAGKETQKGGGEGGKSQQQQQNQHLKEGKEVKTVVPSKRAAPPPPLATSTLKRGSGMAMRGGSRPTALRGSALMTASTDNTKPMGLTGSMAAMRPTSALRDWEDATDEDDGGGGEGGDNDAAVGKMSAVGKMAAVAKPMTVAEKAEAFDSLEVNYRACLQYFLPPAWRRFTKDSITAMPLHELLDFPLEDFFQEYEKGLKGLMTQWRNEGDATKATLVQYRTRLGSLRTQVARLIEKSKNKPPNALQIHDIEELDNVEIEDLLAQHIQLLFDSNRKGG